jgi:TonB-dependent SusC/RagA subfamily outer membrane receptor
VIDEKGSPVPAASVLIKGTSSGTVSDMDGRYNINVTMGETLVFSSVSFLTQEVVVNGSSMNITLREDANLLEQVVVIGYGSLEKRKVTSAITNVDEKDFNKGNVNNPAQLLQGKVAGLSIVAPQGNPNGNFDIRLRGLSTLGANSQPLVIIDGVAGVNLNSVDPNDIATIDVLKDGGAAAIYGTRGSSGVIIITTKNGTTGTPRLDYSGYVTTESTDRSHPVMDKATYLANGGTDLGGENNWLDNITRNAISHVHNVSLSGGANQFTYRASLNFRDAQGVTTWLRRCI